MHRCIELAEAGLGYAAPNPLVGALLVHEGKIIGEGYHREFGKAHAEVNAIKDAERNSQGNIPDGTSLYVNLEPCDHQGKTPPCTDLILSKKISRVIIGCVDPSEKVHGRGIQKLKSNGVEVISDVLQEASKYLNRRFFTFHEKKRPYVILKFAMSADGYLSPEDASGGIHWITGTLSRKLVHKWRSEESAILAGFRTIVTDNPELTVRDWTGRNPVRIIPDRQLELSKESRVLNNAAPTLVFNEKENRKGNPEYIQIAFASPVKEISDILHKRNIQSLIVEGGRQTLIDFIQSGTWDEARVFMGKSWLCGGTRAPELPGIIARTTTIENDTLFHIFPR